MNDIIERVLPLLQQRAQVKKAELIVEIESDLPLVYCDADKAGRVISNLVVNAIKFAGDQGPIVLRAKADPARRQVVIDVSDNGPGIDKKSLEQIFQRFRQLSSQAKSTAKGFGLGLSIAQQLCRLNLGALRVESQVDEGSTFSFDIPNADPPEILRRWLKLERSTFESLQVVEITIDEFVQSSTADEFDSFLNCLLRQSDLLVRLGANQWTLVMMATAGEADHWFSRAKKEFERTNRNRPLGPLPRYRAEVRCSWTSPQNDHDTIVEEFGALFETEKEPMMVT